MKKTIVAVIAVALVGVTVAYRVLSMGGPLGGFENDQFVTLSQAQQIVMGDWPMRDFEDLGKPLTLMLSVVGQATLGHTLFAEAVTTSGILGICAAILFVLSWRASGSIPIALLVALIQIAMAPRFYNFPKLLAYAIAIPAFWWYLDRPDRRRLAVMAAAGVAAFLLRHDHGVYVGLAAIAAVVLAHQRDARRMAHDIGVLGGIAFVLVLPYLVFVQAHGGVVTHFQSFVRYADQTAQRTAFRGVPMSFDWSKPFVMRVAAPAPRPRINVRWAEGTGAAGRSGRERALGLIDPEPRSAGVVNYELADRSPARLAEIVRDAAIADTEGIDRHRFVLDDPFYTHVPTARERAFAYVRTVRVLPGVLHTGNAVPFLYYVMYAVPIAALLILFRRGDTATPVPWNRPAAKMAVVAVLALLVDWSFLRGNLTSRLADVSEVVGVLAAWVAAVALARPSRRARIAAAAAVLLALVATSLSVEGVEHVTAQLVQTGATAGTGGLRERAASIHEALSATPPVVAWPDDTPGMERVARYVNACTAPGDRVLAVGYMPELFFMAHRPFAAGSVWIQPKFFQTAADQRLMIERIVRYRVPIAITVPEPEYTTEYVAAFPLLTAMLRTEYDEIGTTDFGRGFRFRVLARRDMTPARRYAFEQLPCFS